MAGSRTLGSTIVACEDVGRMLGFVSFFFFLGGETSAVSLDGETWMMETCLGLLRHASIFRLGVTRT